MTPTARLLLTALTATALAVLTGCANHPELRPYTAQETRQLQLESLQRRGLSLDQYELHKRVIERSGSQQVVTESVEVDLAIKG